MPRVHTINGIAVLMYFMDHSPPHFHALYAEHEALIEIETLNVYAGSLPRSQLREVLTWASANKDLLRNRWAAMHCSGGHENGG